MSVPFRVYDGRIQANPKHFYLAFSWDESSLSRSIPPNEAEIFILNRKKNLACFHLCSNAITLYNVIGIAFHNQPQNVTANLDGNAFFPCTRIHDGNGSMIPLPLWQIRFSNKSTIIVIGRDNLPPNHVRNATGLSVTVEDIELNFTAYTCFYLINVPYAESYQPCRVYSNTGYLTINFPHTAFILSLPAGSKPYVSVGQSINFLVNKQGGGDFTFNVTVNVDIIIGKPLIITSYFTKAICIGNVVHINQIQDLL